MLGIPESAASPADAIPESLLSTAGTSIPDPEGQKSPFTSKTSISTASSRHFRVRRQSMEQLDLIKVFVYLFTIYLFHPIFFHCELQRVLQQFIIFWFCSSVDTRWKTFGCTGSTQRKLGRAKQSHKRQGNGGGFLRHAHEIPEQTYG